VLPGSEENEETLVPTKSESKVGRGSALKAKEAIVSSYDEAVILKESAEPILSNKTAQCDIILKLNSEKVDRPEIGEAVKKKALSCLC
jgi:hypothetical protein